MFSFLSSNEPIVWPRGEKTKVKNFIGVVGITEDELFEARKNKSLNDAIWSTLQKHLVKNKTTGDLENIISIYHCLERVVVSEGKNANYLVRLRMVYELERYRKMDCPIVIIVCPEDSCSECKKLDGKEYKISEAIKIKPLPPENCTCQRCSCIY